MNNNFPFFFQGETSPSISSNYGLVSFLSTLSECSPKLCFLAPEYADNEGGRIKTMLEVEQTTGTRESSPYPERLATLPSDEYMVKHHLQKPRVSSLFEHYLSWPMHVQMPPRMGIQVLPTLVWAIHILCLKCHWNPQPS